MRIPGAFRKESFEMAQGKKFWVQGRSMLRQLPVALFGASTGAAAALIAAAGRPGVTRAVISRGGRPDLADENLPRVEAPTLLIVGGDDKPVIEMNRDAMRRMRAPAQLEIVPGATLIRGAGSARAGRQIGNRFLCRHLTRDMT
jgi:putative phosphoribosyl transferase